MYISQSLHYRLPHDMLTHLKHSRDYNKETSKWKRKVQKYGYNKNRNKETKVLINKQKVSPQTLIKHMTKKTIETH